MDSMTHMPSLTTTVSAELLGTVAVVDLEAACELYGRAVLPYPLGRSRPVGSVWLATREVEPIDDRLTDGDLRGIRAWVEALVRADVCVECRVTFTDEDSPDLRLHALRSGEVGFAAVQSSDRDAVDIVDIYTMSPEVLGAVIADSVGLTGAGEHARIAVPGFEDRLPASPEMLEEYDDFGFPIPRAEPQEPAVRTVERHDVVATGTVQSRYDPARHWGVDPERRVLQWVQVGDDGDYLYAPGDAGYAEPVDAETLCAYIDGLIADEFAVMRERRGLG
jgi:hypothetical protein